MPMLYVPEVARRALVTTPGVPDLGADPRLAPPRVAEVAPRALLVLLVAERALRALVAVEFAPPTVEVAPRVASPKSHGESPKSHRESPRSRREHFLSLPHCFSSTKTCLMPPNAHWEHLNPSNLLLVLSMTRCELETLITVADGRGDVDSPPIDGISVTDWPILLRLSRRL